MDTLPEPRWICGVCPRCGGSLVANLYWIGGRGYVFVEECWDSLSASPICSYRKIL